MIRKSSEGFTSFLIDKVQFRLDRPTDLLDRWVAPAPVGTQICQRAVSPHPRCPPSLSRAGIETAIGTALPQNSSRSFGAMSHSGSLGPQ